NGVKLNQILAGVAGLLCGGVSTMETIPLRGRIVPESHPLHARGPTMTGASASDRKHWPQDARVGVGQAVGPGPPGHIGLSAMPGWSARVTPRSSTDGCPSSET